MLTLVVVTNLFPRFKMWHVLTSNKYTWSQKQIPGVEWDTQEETQQLESPHRFAHICCQITSLSPGLSYDQQCYQWFTGKLNCLMDAYPSNSAGESNEATQLWNGHGVKDLCPTPTAFSVTQMDVKMSRKHIVGQKSLYPKLNLVVEKL